MLGPRSITEDSGIKRAFPHFLYNEKILENVKSVLSSPHFSPHFSLLLVILQGPIDVPSPHYFPPFGPIPIP